MISKFTSSHDNLIRNLYKEELTILPIRIATLDFHNLVKENQLTPASRDAIEQAKYVTA